MVVICIQYSNTIMKEREFMYILFSIFIIILLFFFVINHSRKKCIIRKICCMTLEEKCNLLNAIIEPMGFSYLLIRTFLLPRVMPGSAKWDISHFITEALFILIWCSTIFRSTLTTTINLDDSALERTITESTPEGNRRILCRPHCLTGTA